MPPKKHNRLQYAVLEERRCLANVAAVGAQTVELTDFAASELVSISESGNTQTLRLVNGDTWHGHAQAGIRGLGTARLAVDRSLWDIQIEDDRLAPTLDVIFSTDIAYQPGMRWVNFVGQLPGTRVTLNDYVWAEALVLEELSNTIDVGFINADYVSLRSDGAMRINNARLGSGSITAGGSFLARTPFAGSEWQVAGSLTLQAKSIDILVEKVGVSGFLSLIAPEHISLKSQNVYDENWFGDLNGFSRLARLNVQSLGDVHLDVRQMESPFTSPTPLPPSGPDSAR